MRPRFQTLQVGRGLAALAVVLFHANSLINQYTSAFFSRLLLPGQSGVDFFFVLSGFIIFTTHERDFGKRDRVAEFLRRRVIRIYPVYLLLTALFLCFYALHFGHYDKLNAETVIKSILLLPQRGDARPIITVAWTLTHEVLFYAVFAVLICVNLRARWLLSGTLLLLTAINCIYPIGGSVYWISTWILSPFNLEFASGCFAAWLAARYTVRPLLWAGFVTLVPVWWLTSYQTELHLGQHSPVVMLCLFGLPYFLIVAGLASLERTRIVSPPTAFVALGDATYSIYLSHFVVVTAVVRTCSRHHLPALISILAAVIVSVLVGWLLYRFVENPLLVRMKNRKTLPAPSPYTVLSNTTSSSV